MQEKKKKKNCVRPPCTAAMAAIRAIMSFYKLWPLYVPTKKYTNVGALFNIFLVCSNLILSCRFKFAIKFDPVVVVHLPV